MNHRPHLDPHLNDDELIALLYGLGDGETHLAGCSECSERWSAMHSALGTARVGSSKAMEVSGRRLAAQRQQILERLEQPSSGLQASRWIPAAAVAALLAVVLVISRPSSVPPPVPAPSAVVNAEADAQLFTDVYSMEQDVEPKAAAPIRALFQETALEEERQ